MRRRHLRIGRSRHCSERSGLGAATLAPAVEELEEVIVSGIRASMRDSLRSSANPSRWWTPSPPKTSAISPTRTSVKRFSAVPGVQINRQDGEGRSVSIRGADQSLIRVELNGVSALSLTVGGGRDVDFRDLPVEFVSRVEVVKTPTAEMTEGGIGTVRVDHAEAARFARRLFRGFGAGRLQRSC